MILRTMTCEASPLPQLISFNSSLPPLLIPSPLYSSPPLNLHYLSWKNRERLLIRELS